MANGARAIIENTLAEYGLATGMANDGKVLADWAWDRYLDTGDADQVMVELRSQQAFKDRFPAYDELAKAGRALSPAEYVAYEKAVYAQFQSYGVPGGILDDKETITEMLLNDVSAAEVSERLALNAQATLTAPEEVRTALMDMYGMSEGGILAYYLDPDRALPKLQQQYVSSQIAGAAAERQFSLDRAEAERLASLGYTYEQTRQAAENAAGVRGLAGGAFGVAESDLLEGGLGGVEAARRVYRAQQSRLAGFSGGGTAAAQNEGVTGLSGSSV